MKNLTKLFVASLLVVSGAQAQVTLNDFSAVLNPNLTFFYGSWEATGSTDGSPSPNATFTQGAGLYEISAANATDSADSKLEFFYETPLNIGTNMYLAVTATELPTNLASSFQITLVDSLGKTAYAAFAIDTFLVGAYSMQSSLLTMQSGFNSASIDSFFISGGQPGSTIRFNIGLDHIAAVAIPEPSTYVALLALAVLGFVAYRRRFAVAA